MRPRPRRGTGPRRIVAAMPPSSAHTGRPPSAPLWRNAMLFQLGWWACVLGAAHGRPLWGTATAAAIVAVHLWQAPQRWPEARLAGQALLLGLAFESLMAAQGWLSYPHGHWLPGLAPHWLVALWPLLATTLNSSMRWLQPRPWLASALGAVLSPLSYAAGVRLGAASFNDPTRAMAALAIGWALLMPLLVGLARRSQCSALRPNAPSAADVQA